HQGEVGTDQERRGCGRSCRRQGAPARAEPNPDLNEAFRVTARLELAIRERRQEETRVVVLPATRMHGADTTATERGDETGSKLGAGAILTHHHHASRPSLNRRGQVRAFVEPAAGAVAV